MNLTMNLGSNFLSKKMFILCLAFYVMVGCKSQVNTTKISFFEIKYIDATSKDEFKSNLLLLSGKDTILKTINKQIDDFYMLDCDNVFYHDGFKLYELKSQQELMPFNISQGIGYCRVCPSSLKDSVLVLFGNYQSIDNVIEGKNDTTFLFSYNPTSRHFTKISKIYKNVPVEIFNYCNAFFYQYRNVHDRKIENIWTYYLDIYDLKNYKKSTIDSLTIEAGGIEGKFFDPNLVQFYSNNSFLYCMGTQSKKSIYKYNLKTHEKALLIENINMENINSFYYSKNGTMYINDQERIITIGNSKKQILYKALKGFYLKGIYVSD